MCEVQIKYNIQTVQSPWQNVALIMERTWSSVNMIHTWKQLTHWIWIKISVMYSAEQWNLILVSVGALYSQLFLEIEWNFSISLKRSHHTNAETWTKVYFSFFDCYTVSFLFENTRLIYFMLLKLTISWINIFVFKNHGPDNLDKCSLLQLRIS
jgi:hypothetical protein